MVTKHSNMSACRGYCSQLILPISFFSFLFFSFFIIWYWDLIFNASTNNLILSVHLMDYTRM